MCGLFGVVGYKDKKTDAFTKMVRALGAESEVRGTDAGGLSYLSDKALNVVRNKGAISHSGVFDKLTQNRVVMGHTRMTTQGSATFAYNNHPFPSVKGRYAMAHNGVIWNDATLAKEYNLPDTKVQTDSYIVVRLLDHLHKGVVNFETLRSVAELLQGQFNLTFQTQDGIWIVRHNNPLEVLNLEAEGMIIYASTKDILVKALSKYFDTTDLMDYLIQRKATGPLGSPIKTNSGDILFIKNDGSIERGSFTPKAYTPTYPKGGYDYDDYYDYQPKKSKFYDDYEFDVAHNCWVKRPVTKTPTVLKDPLTTWHKDRKSALEKSALIFNGDETEVGYVFKHSTSGKDAYFSVLKGKTLIIDGEDVSIVHPLTNANPIKKPDDLFYYNQDDYDSFVKALELHPSLKKVKNTTKLADYHYPGIGDIAVEHIKLYLMYHTSEVLNPDDFYAGVAYPYSKAVTAVEVDRIVNAELDKLALFKTFDSLYTYVFANLSAMDSWAL